MNLFPPGFRLVVACLLGLLPSWSLAQTPSPIELLVTTPDGETLKYNEPAALRLNAGQQTHSLRVRNISESTLIGVQVIRNPDAATPGTVLFVPNLAPGAEAAFQASAEDIHPDVPENNRVVTYRIQDSNSTEWLRFSIDYRLYPVYSSIFGWVSPTRLALVGSQVTFNTQVHPSYVVRQRVWRQGSKNISTDQQLKLTLLKLTDAAPYRQQISYASAAPGGVGIGSALSPVMLLGVVQPAPASAEAYQGKPLILTSTAAAPSGTKLGYQWYHNGTALENTDGLKGSTTAKLQIPADHAQRTGTFHCMISLTGNDRTASLSHGSTVVTELPRPVFTPLEDYSISHYAGENVSYQVEVSHATKLTAKGLPKGLTMDATGLITGSTTRAGTYKLTVTASNGGGSVSQVYQGEMKPMLAPGSHHALAARAPAEGETPVGLGSYLKLKATTTGSVSGQLIHEGQTYRFSGTPVLSHLVEEEYEWEGETHTRITPHSLLQIKRGKRPALALEFFPGIEASFTVTDPETGHTTTGLLRQGLPTTAPHIPLGRYTARLTSAAPGPLGDGYITGSLTAKNLLTWTGKLPDGSVITGSDFLSAAVPYGEPDETTLQSLPIHSSLYKGTGSLHGWAEFETLAENAGEPTISSTLTWTKRPQTDPRSKDRIYKTGIPLHDVTLTGGLYTPPARGELLFGLTANEIGDTTPNLTFTATGPNVPSGSFIQDLLLNIGNKFKLPKVSTDTLLKSLTLNTKTGTFKGSFTLLHASDAKLNRTATLEGILPNNVNDQAQGFFLLPDLPEEEGETLKTTAIQSGRVEIEKAVR